MIWMVNEMNKNESEIIVKNKLFLKLLGTISRFINFNVSIRIGNERFLLKLPEIMHIWEIYFLDIYGIRKLVNKNTIVIDVGAHKGVYAIPTSKRSMLVFCFEPIAENIRYLNFNIKSNRCENIEIIPFALWKTSGYVKIKKTAMSGSSHIVDSCGENDDLCINVKSMTLDDFTKTIQSRFGVDNFDIVVKIDTEGSEYEILKGSKKFIEEFRPTFVIEVHSKKSYENMIKFFSKYGYTLKPKTYVIKIFGTEVMYATILYAFPS